MATVLPLSAARRRSRRRRWACSAEVPWEKFRRATFMPASSNAARRSLLLVAGPNVQMILARRGCKDSAGLEVGADIWGRGACSLGSAKRSIAGVPTHSGRIYCLNCLKNFTHSWTGIPDKGCAIVLLIYSCIIPVLAIRPKLLPSSASGLSRILSAFLG